MLIAKHTVMGAALMRDENRNNEHRLKEIKGGQSKINSQIYEERIPVSLIYFYSDPL
jgi:hypothetical protein